jgi:BlaI family transcriptional regulator, penicillinase repressor
LTSTKIFVYKPSVASELETFPMKKGPKPRPTDGELAILRALWQLGPATVRQVQEALNPDKETGYTTVLKLMQIMHEKGLLTRDESERTHVYRAALSEEHTQRQLVDHLLERAFGGSARQLVMQVLSSRKASSKELAQIRGLLDELEGGRK